MPRILIINNAEPDDNNFIIRLEQAVTICSAGVMPDIISYQEAPYQLDRINAAQAVILSGVPRTYSLGTAKRRQPYMTWLSSTTARILGICVGHQIIGVHHSVNLISKTEKEGGLCQIETLQDDPIFAGLGRSFEAFSNHWASIPIPDNFIHLAKSRPGLNSPKGCNNQVMVDSQKRIYSCQFHPEESEKGLIFLSNFIKQAPSQLHTIEPFDTTAVENHNFRSKPTLTL